MGYILETERLLLRQFDLNDTAFIIQLLNSPGWLEYIGDRNVRTEDQAKNFLLNGPFKSYRENGFGSSLVELKEGNIPIGMCGLIKREHLDSPDIGFAFLPEYVGKGYAFEIAEAMMNYAKNELKLPNILAIVLPNNTSSIKLLEKIGLKSKSTFTFPDGNEELLLFSN